ncbi:MAG: O-antigen ligase family protein [Thermodesulfobacteriota bacterium]
MVTAILSISILILLVFIFSPLNLAMVYVAIRPLLQPFATLQYSFFGLPTTTVHAIVMVVAAIISVMRGRGRIWIKHIVLLYVLLFFSLLSFYNVPDLMEALGGMLKLLTAISLFILIYNSVNNLSDGIRFMTAVSFSAVIPILVGFYQALTGNYSMIAESTMDRVSSIIGVANAYGIYLSLVTIPTLALILLGIRKKTNLVILIMILCSQILALNRGTWIAFTFAGICGSIIYFRQIKIKWLVAGSLVLLIIGVVFSGIIISRFEALEDPSVYGAQYNTFEQRVNYWKSVLPIIADKPLIGHGLGSSAIVSKKYFHTEAVPHNDYIRFALETGIPGTLIYILFLMLEFLRNLQLALARKKWQVNYPMLILLIYYIVISTTQNIYFNLINFPLFLSLVAVAIKLNKVQWGTEENFHEKSIKHERQ